MRRFLLLPLMIIALVGFAKAQGTTEKEADPREVKKEVLQVEEELTEAYSKGDTNALDRLWPDDFVYINSSGEILTKAQHLADFQSGVRKFNSFKLDLTRQPV